MKEPSIQTINADHCVRVAVLGSSNVVAGCFVGYLLRAKEVAKIIFDESLRRGNELLQQSPSQRAAL